LDNLKTMEAAGWVCILRNVEVPLYEFKIPRTRRGGVVRIYFAYSKNEENAIVLFTAELKKKEQIKSQTN